MLTEDQCWQLSLQREVREPEKADKEKRKSIFGGKKKDEKKDSPARVSPRVTPTS